MLTAARKRITSKNEVIMVLRTLSKKRFRLVYHSVIVEVNVSSYRVEEAKMGKLHKK